MRAHQPAVRIERTGEGERVEISFGNATLHAPRASEEQRAHGVEESRRAMERLAKALLSLPGIELQRTPEVPRFYADGQNPELVIRDLDGVRQRGIFVDGRFIEL